MADRVARSVPLSHRSTAVLVYVCHACSCLVRRPIRRAFSQRLSEHIYGSLRSLSVCCFPRREIHFHSYPSSHHHRKFSPPRLRSKVLYVRFRVLQLITHTTSTFTAPRLGESIRVWWTNLSTLSCRWQRRNVRRASARRFVLLI